MKPLYRFCRGITSAGGGGAGGAPVPEKPAVQGSGGKEQGGYLIKSPNNGTDFEKGQWKILPIIGKVRWWKAEPKEKKSSCYSRMDMDTG